MAGHRRGCTRTALVGKCSQWLMHLPVQKEPCRQSGTIKSVTLLQGCSQRFAPTLQPLNGESFPLRSTNTEEGARLDIRAQNFWDTSKRNAFFDVRVFNSHASSNSKSTTKACYRRHEREKRREYERRVLEVEHGTFTPLVLSTSGGWGPSATVAFRRLAGLIATKHNQAYSTTLQFIRCKISTLHQCAFGGHVHPSMPWQTTSTFVINHWTSSAERPSWVTRSP